MVVPRGQIYMYNVQCYKNPFRSTMTARKGNIYTGFIRSALRTYKKVWLSKITLNWEFVFLPRRANLSVGNCFCSERFK